MVKQEMRLSTVKQKGRIHIEVNNLGWTEEFYRSWLNKNFGVRSSKDLTISQASKAIRMIESVQVATGRAPYQRVELSDRIQRWNNTLTGKGAWRGLAIGGSPCKQRDLRHVCGMLWEVSRGKQDEITYAKKIIQDVTGTDKIRNQEQLNKLKAVLKGRAREQGLPHNETMRGC